MTREIAIERVRVAIEEIKAGKMVILVDDEDRENEGDLVMASELVTPDAITFMATKACGLICATFTYEQIEKLELPMMVKDNQAPLGTAFTISIEAREGVTTGISAADRAHTIKVASNPQCTASEIVSPGHVFPLRAMPGGVLQRNGQTEGSVDLARLAGLTPAGTICEIMKTDGTMARMPDLEIFAKEHNLAIVTIADMVEYRLQKDRLVERQSSTKIELHGDTASAVFDAHIYSAIPGVRRHEYVALTLGDVTGNEPVPCRGHMASLIDDVFGGNTRKNSPPLKKVIDSIISRGTGVILYLPSRESMETDLIHAGETPTTDPDGAIRELGIGAQILLDLGVNKLQVISNNPHRLVGLDAYGFESVEQIKLEEV